ncbi:MAG: hypothetical protein ACK4P5_04280 [Fimbriimonadales bacterium]
MAARLRNAPIGECLSFEQVVTLARRGRRAPGYHEQMLHAISCPACRRMVLQARVLVRAQRPSWMRWLRQLSLPRPLVWAPASGVAAIALAFFLWQGRGGEQTIASLPPTDTRSEPSVSVVSSQSPDALSGGFRPSVSDPRTADTRITIPDTPARPRKPTPPAPPSSQRELQLAQQMPAFVREAIGLLNQATAFATRSAPTSAAPWLEFIQPDLQRNTSISADTLRFQWSPVPDAESYQLTLQQADGGIVAEAQLSAEQTGYALSEPLQAGQYKVVISVIVAEKPARTLRRKFYVLDTEQQRAYEWAQSHAETLPLLSAAVFYQIDRYADALRCIERAAQKYPEDERVNQWRQVIQTRINARIAEFSE